MTTSNYVRLGGALLVAMALQGCGGGGGAENGAFFPAVSPPAATPASSGSDAGSPNPTGSGSGSGAMPSVGGTGQPVFPVPYATQSTAGKAIQAGLHSVSYGMGTINFEQDKSIWRTALRGNITATALEVVNAVYAGNAQGGGDALAEAKRPLFDPAKNRAGTNVDLVRFDDTASTLSVGSNSASGFVPALTWGLSVTAVDLAGQSIEDFLKQNYSRTKPIEGLTVSGAFTAGAEAYRIHYSALTNVLLFGRSSAFIRSQAEFERSFACAAGSNDANRLAYRIEAGGTLKILEVAQGTTCTTEVLAAGVAIGSGTWMNKTSGDVNYVEINFPPSISFQRFDNSFLASEYDAGVRGVMLISNNGEWNSGHLIPAGVSFQSRNLSLNKLGAENVRTSLGM